jgi:hypothetical protein
MIDIASSALVTNITSLAVNYSFYILPATQASHPWLPVGSDGAVLGIFVPTMRIYVKFIIILISMGFFYDVESRQSREKGRIEHC